MYKAAVIGLGNIGFQFNTDPKRKGTWSHVSAYEKCKKTKLVGAVEVDAEKINIFRQYKNIPIFKTVKELMESIEVDILSICTPTETHCLILKELLKYPVKAIFCEKPFASNLVQAWEMVCMCREKKVVLAVNHTRRWQDNFLFVKEMIHDGKVGRLRGVNVFYPGQIFNIGTHLFDVVRMLIQKKPETVSGISFNLDNRDPDISGWIQFNENILCTVVSTGKREDLIFEVDLIGDEGRIRILENGEKVELYSFTESLRYSGYRELSLVPVDTSQTKDRFVEAVTDIVKVIDGEKSEVNCTGKDGLYALAMSFAMLESAKKHGILVKVGTKNAL